MNHVKTKITAMFIITEHQVLTSYFEQKLAKKYQYERPQIQKYHKGCLDTFCYYGKEVDLSTVKNRKVLLQFTLHYQHIIQRYQDFYKATKGDKDSAIQKAFPMCCAKAVDHVERVERLCECAVYCIPCAVGYVC